MNLLSFASFVWGAWNGYKHSTLIAVLAISAALVVGDIWLNWSKLSQGGSKNGVGLLIGGLAFYVVVALMSSLASQGFGYLIGYYIIGWII
jgi:hypothetical protein